MNFHASVMVKEMLAMAVECGGSWFWSGWSCGYWSQSASTMKVYVSDDRVSSESGEFLNCIAWQQQVREDNGIAD